MTTAMCLTRSLRFCDLCSSSTPALEPARADPSNATWVIYARSPDARPSRAGNAASTRLHIILILRSLGGMCHPIRVKSTNGPSAMTLPERLPQDLSSPLRVAIKSPKGTNLIFSYSRLLTISPSYPGCLRMCEECRITTTTSGCFALNRGRI
jgi:hypothetical protein